MSTPVAAGLAMPQPPPGPGGGSLVSFEVSTDGRMASVSFQSTAMGAAFSRFPRALLVHRVGAPAGRALYVFLVAGPAPALRGGMARVVHLAIPRDESVQSLDLMYVVFRAFNPAAAQTRLVLLGPDVLRPPALAHAFPAATVELSVFHLCKWLQQLVLQLGLERHTESLALTATRKAAVAGIEMHRRELLAFLRDLIRPDLLPQLHLQWLLDDSIWAAHREGSWGESSDYFEELEVINQGLSQVFSAGLSLEICITTLAQHYEECVSKSSPDGVVCSAPPPDHCAAQAAPQSLPASDSTLAPLVCQGNTSQTSSQAFHTKAAAQQQPVSDSLADGGSPVRVLHIPPAAHELPEALQHQPETSQPLLQSEPTTSQALLPCSSPVVKWGATETSEDDNEEEINRRSEEGIRQSLDDICTEPAARLCLGELAVVQKSVQLIGTGEDMLSVQILEDAHRVDLKDLNSCTCHFNQAFQVPCRHILAVLNSNRKPSQPEMLSRPREGGCDAHQAGQDSADGLLEVLKNSWDKSLDKSQVVSFLKAEISQQLTHCSEEEFEHRYKTLRELADNWLGPSVKVKL